MNRYCWRCYDCLSLGHKAPWGMYLFLGILLLGKEGTATAEGLANQAVPQGPKSSFQVPVPGLGQNPWLVESYFKQNGLAGPDGRDAAIQEQLRTLKKLLEGQNFPLSSQQKTLLENLIQSPGISGPGVESLKELAKGLISKADPSQQDFLREKLAGVGRSGGVGDLLGSLGKLTPPGQSTFQGLPRNLLLPKTIAPPIPEPDLPFAMQTKGPNSQPQPSPAFVPTVVPPAPPKVGDLSRMFSRILPFGLDKAMAPLGKEMVVKGKDLLRGFKIPESWKPALKDTFKGFNLPNSLAGGAPTLPRAPFGDSISGSKMVLGCVGSFALLFLLIWFLPKMIKVGKTPGQSHPRFPSSGTGEGLVARLERAVLKWGGGQLAFGNHRIWKEHCGPRFVSLGMAEEVVDHVFSVYETAKYSKLDLPPQTEERLVETLKRYV